MDERTPADLQASPGPHPPASEPAAGAWGDLFDLAPTPQAVFDSQGRCLLANQAFSNRLGPGPDRRPARPIFFQDLVEGKVLAEEFFDELRARKILRRWELDVRDREGKFFPALISGRLLDLMGADAFEISITDITKQKRLQLALAKEHLRLSSVIDNLSVGIFLVDQEGQIIQINRYLANLLDIEPEQLVAHPHQELMALLAGRAHEPELVLQSLSGAAAETSDSPTLSFTLQGEKDRHLDLALFSMLDHKGLVAGWGGLLQDVTALRDQVSWRLELLSILAHDIRTPLATLKGYTGALLANYRDWDHEMVAGFLEAMNRGVEDLTHQVDQSLALTRVESGRLGLLPEAAHAGALVRRSVERAAALVKGTRIEIDVPEDLPQVRVDPARVEEVVINLLENAVRYSPAGEAVWIRARLRKPWVELTVADSGPGIPQEQRARIFEKFNKGDPATGGAGLGLYISRKIVDAHGGRIWVESPPDGAGRGAAFSFTLPVMPASGGRAWIERGRPAIAAGHQGDAPRVLVVEDDPDLQTLLRTILIRRGYQVEVAADGPTALDIVHASSPEVVLLDWVLPGMSGMSVCRSIRRWSDVPIMMITSRNSQEDLAAALDAGADDYVTKPFIGSEILARVKALIRRGEGGSPARERLRFSAGGLVIDFETRQGWIRGEALDLTPTEYRLLAYFARHPRQVLTYDQLIAGVWGEGGVTRPGLFAHLSRLRNKIEENPHDPRLIRTKRAVGYIFLEIG